MSLIYSTTIKAWGPSATEFAVEKMVVTFADNVPEALADFVYYVIQNPVLGELAVGQRLSIGEDTWEVTAVGDVARKNLNDLGHLTLVFDGGKEPLMPGAVHVSAGSMPTITPGVSLTITS